MPRLESIAAAGYFPTPPEVVTRLIPMVRRASHGGRVVMRLLDPAAGTGEALRQLADGIGGETYGVELEADRASTAADVLDHVVAGNALAARIQEGAFSLLLLNPPYDTDVGAHRLEHTFLTACTPYLHAGGMLVYIVPQQQLHESARYLAGHYRDIACWRFPDPYFARFGQVVVLATRREQPTNDGATRARIEEWSRAALPVLPPAGDGIPRALPVLPTGDILFSAYAFDPALAAVEAQRSGVWAHAALLDRIWPPKERAVRPLMPLRQGHLALLIAAGFLDSVALESKGRRLLVKGRTYKVWTEAYSPDPDVEVQREELRTSVTVLDLRTGELQVVDTGGKRS